MHRGGHGSGIQCLIHYPIPAHTQKAYSHLGYKQGDLPSTEYIARRILSLPMFPELTNEQVDLVIEGIREFYRGNDTCQQPQGRSEKKAPKLVTQPR